MKISERLKNKYSAFISTGDSAKIDRLLITLLSCVVLLVVVIVSLINFNGIDADDPYAMLFGFRTLILTGVGIVGGVFIILAINRAKLEWHFLAISLGIGIIFMFTMTPLAGTDEQLHYLKSAYMSSLMIDWGSTTFSRVSDFDFSNLGPHHNYVGAYLRLLYEGIGPVDSAPAYRYVDHLPYFMMHFLQAIGISLGRFLGLNFFGVFYLGRFINLLFFVLCGFFAIRAVKEFKLPILITAILPMTLHQAASYSPDTFINGASILFIAYLVRCLYEREEWSAKDIAVLAASGILLAPAKTVYFAIVLLLLFAAPYKYGWKNAKGYIIGGAIVAIGLVNILVFNLVDLQSTAATAPVERWHGGTNFTLDFIFENPWETFLIFLRTLWHFGEFYLLSMFGHQMSGMTLILPRWQIYAFIFILVASLFYGNRESWIPAWSHRAMFFIACAAVVVLSLLGMFLAWTPDTHGVILGIQGRYFIPILPLAILMLRNKFMLGRRIFAYALIGSSVVVHFFVIQFILDFTIPS